MKRFSQLFLYITITLLLLWQLPWCYTFFTAKSSSTPFVLYSEILDDFITMESEEGKGMVRRDLSGTVYAQEQVDSLLPFFYVRQLMTDERFPDTVKGVAVTPKEVQLTNFTFRISPKDINAETVPLYPLLESKSKRVDLVMPDDVFRMTDSGITFIKMASNTIDEKKSQRYTEALKKKGFTFPVYRIAGNPTARKEYDEGYLLLDSKQKLFHLKQVVGRPYVRAIPLAKGIKPSYLFVTEFRNRQILGFFTDAENRFYVLDAQYGIKPTELPHYNPEKESMTLFGNMLSWTVTIKEEKQAMSYALDAERYTLLKSVHFPIEDSSIQGLHFTSAYDKWVKPRF